ALGIGAGDEVILPAFTYHATASAVAQAGARPVFADVEPVRFGLDPSSVEERIGPRTRAILPVHLYGLACDLDAVAALAERNGLALLEDAAQAIGATRNGIAPGKTGVGATLSFFPTKNLGALGDAGAFATDREDLAAQVRLLRAQGDAGNYRHTEIGTNARLDSLQAAFLRTKLRHLPEWVDARRAAAARYRTALAGVPVTLPAEPGDSKHTYHQFTIRTRDRDRMQAFLKDRGIASRVYYPIPLHLQPCFADLGHRAGEFPVAESLAREVLSLPIFPGITEEEIARVTDAVREFFEARPAGA
ncbi:MAG TPA: DegT/DnrJ/EryC1/StrS family aminotransferase, partial [Candidatus Eisenbacteria bacterium]|nr:DegT/DnrJ/EryC1/StrS family aminotransferase [Candidatus Eisenbacteria bacterium]